MEKKFVYEVYDKIAPHFSNTRYKPWPKVYKFLDSLDDGCIIADVGITLFIWKDAEMESIWMWMKILLK